MHGRILYLIADLYDGDERVRSALDAGVDYVQLREKNITSAKYLQDALHMRHLVDEYNAKNKTDTKLIINDRLDIAVLSKADGVHLGADDVPVGMAREFLGRDFIIGGAFHLTATKPDAKAITPELYKQILDAVSIPDVAIGGITVDNCNLPLECGADGLAVSAGILKMGDAGENVRLFRKKLLT